MCKWSDPFSKCVLIDRGLDHNSLEALIKSQREVAVIIQFWRHVLLKTLDKVDQLWYTEPVKSVGVDDGKVPPVPIPNTEVKLTCAEDS